MASFVPSNPETYEDRARYISEGLTAVECMDCLVSVAVRKNSEHQTAIQWTFGAEGQCRSASSFHWIEVWCSLFFFTATRARQSRHATSVSRALV